MVGNSSSVYVEVVFQLTVCRYGPTILPRRNKLHALSRRNCLFGKTVPETLNGPDINDLTVCRKNHSKNHRSEHLVLFSLFSVSRIRLIK